MSIFEVIPSIQVHSTECY